MKKRISGTAIIAATLALCACSQVGEQFDFSKKAPDEFAVVKRAPLEMPTDLSRLPPPRPGAPRPQEPSTTDLARSAVVGTDAQRDIAAQNNVSQGEAVLLQKTGAAGMTPAIRDAVDKETSEIADKEMPGIDHLRRMVGQNVEGPAKVVDPVAEANRIKQNKAQGKPITTGETPVKDED